MQCPKCKKEIKNDSIFCEYCGNQVKNSQRGISSYVFWKWSTIISFTSLLVSLLIPQIKSNNQELLHQIQEKDHAISFLEEQIKIYKKNEKTNDSIHALVHEKDTIIKEQDKYINLLRKENEALRQVL